MIPHLRSGGAQKVCLGLAAASTQSGHHVGILTFMPGNDYEDRLRLHQMEVQNVPYDGGFGITQFPKLRKLAKTLHQNVKTFNPDIIHAHLYLSQEMLLFMPRLNARVLITQHDNNPWWGQSSFKYRIQTLVDRLTSKYVADDNVCISKSVEKDVRSYLGVPAARTRVIYNFVDVPNCGLDLSAENANFPTLVLMSRLYMEKKGIDTALEAIAILVKTYPDIRLNLVGKGPDEDRIRSLIHRLNLDNVVNWRGFRSDVYKELSYADVVLVPSRWEGFGLAAAEAAMAMKPVVATRVGGLAEVVLHQETGLLVAAGDPQDLASKIRFLLDHEEKRKQMGRKGRERAMAEFCIDVSYNQYEEAYQGLLEK